MCVWQCAVLIAAVLILLVRPDSEYISNPEKWGGEALADRSVCWRSDRARFVLWSAGGIELAILAAHFEAEIAAVDIQTTNILLFGQGNGYKQRAYLLYNGIHYDALVSNPAGESGDAKQDVLTFDPNDKAVFDAAKALASSLQKVVARALLVLITAFTNLSPLPEQAVHQRGQLLSALLRLYVPQAAAAGAVWHLLTAIAACAAGGGAFVGAVDATEHAKSTGHVNFVQY